jgi:Cation efflux family
VGFGFDSTVEVGSALVVVWQFSGELHGDFDEARERRASRLIAVSFFVLAGYVVIESLRDLFLVDGEPGESRVGITLAGLSLVVMPALALAKRHIATRLGSPTLRADAAETMLCGCFPRCFSSASFSTPQSAGGGRTRWPPSGSPGWP